MEAPTIAKLCGLLFLVLLLGGCASGKKRNAWDPPRWYETDMSTEDKSFFLGSFLKP
jgi:hypothetical protein